MTTAIEQLYRLLGRFEQGPHGGAALTSYLCPSGRWTIAFGCTKHPDGSSIKEGDTITEAQVMVYTEAAVERVLSDIKATVQRPLNEYQLAAIGSFVFNCGIANLQKSTRLLPAIEAGRWEDAADCLTEFVRAWGHYDGKWHRMALLGLRIRRLAEGCLLLGYDWEEACTADNIGMPKRREWQPDALGPDGSKGRYFDVLLDGATEFTTIETIARLHPLPALQAEPRPPNPAASAGQPGAQAPSPLPAAPAPTPKPAATIGGSSVNAGPAAPNVPAKAQPVPSPAPKLEPPPKPPSPYSVPITDAPYRIDPNFGLKPMETTDRWKASVAQNSGMVMMRLARYGFMGTGPATVATYIEKDPIFSGAFIALIGVMAVGGYGYVRKCYGDWLRHHGERRASQAMV